MATKRYEWGNCNAEACVAALSMKFGFEIPEAAEYLHTLGVLREVKAETGKVAAAGMEAALKISAPPTQAVGGAGPALEVGHRRVKSCIPPAKQHRDVSEGGARNNSLSHLSALSCGVDEKGRMRGVRTASMAEEEDEHTGFEQDAEGWTLVVGDPSGGTTANSYYWNERTQEVTWEEPECLRLAKRSAGMHDAAAQAARLMGLSESTRHLNQGAGTVPQTQSKIRKDEEEGGGAGALGASRGYGAAGEAALAAELERVASLKKEQASANPFAKSNYVATGQ